MWMIPELGAADLGLVSSISQSSGALGSVPSFTKVVLTGKGVSSAVP
jgi:hypothetical protein